jgi:hypothetical protein
MTAEEVVGRGGWSLGMGGNWIEMGMDVDVDVGV